MKAKPTVLGLMGVVACFAVGLATVRTNDSKPSSPSLTLFSARARCSPSTVAERGPGSRVFGWAQFLICHPNTAPPVGATSLTNRIAYQLLIRYHDTGRDYPTPVHPGVHERHRRWGRQPLPRVPVEPGPRSDPASTAA